MISDQISVALHHLEMFPVNKRATFSIHMATNNNEELVVTVTGPTTDIPVEVKTDSNHGFVAEFIPVEVGPHIISIDYNHSSVGGTPFTGNAYDSEKVMVSEIPWGTIGKALDFTVDASKAGK